MGVQTKQTIPTPSGITVTVDGTTLTFTDYEVTA
jgi:hypothetical protein